MYPYTYTQEVHLFTLYKQYADLDFVSSQPR